MPLVFRSVVDPGLVVWAARRTVVQHAEEPSEDRVTGRCRNCGDADPCPTLLAALHYLRRCAA